MTMREVVKKRVLKVDPAARRGRRRRRCSADAQRQAEWTADMSVEAWLEGAKALDG